MGRLNKYFFLIPLYVILGSLIAAIIWYAYLSYSLVPQKEKKLWEITLEHEEKINTYLLQQQTNTQTLASDDTTATFLATKSHSKKDDEQYQEFLDTQKQLLGFKNIFLIDNNSTIVFSTIPSVIGKKITENTTEYSALKKSYERAFMALAPDFAYFDYEPLINERALFITTPVVKNKKMVGILAYQFDQEKIYQMINQYIGLGTTGEIVLAQQEDTYALFVAPSRHDPDLAFKKRDLFTKAPISVQASALGGQGTGVATDYRDKKVVGAWTFITKINWGMIVKMDYEEVMEPLTTVSMIIIFLFFVFIIWLLITEYFFHKSIILQLKKLSQTKKFKKIPSLLRNPFFLFFIIATILIIKNIIYYEYTTISTTQKSKAEILDSVDKDVDRIQSILNRISFTTQSLADDLHLQRLSEEDIKNRLNRDIAENTIIQSITIMLTSNAFKKNTLDTVTVYKTSRTDQNMIIEEKYKNEDKLNTIIKSEWFAKTIEKGSYWLKPTKNKNHTNNNNTSSYSLIVRNKQKNIIGLVSLVFKLEPLERIASYNSLNRIGYSILLTQDGTFLFHPIGSLAMEKTFSQFAQESGNKELARLAQEALTGKPLLATYREENTNQLMWLYTKPIPINNWILGTIFPIADITLQSDIIRHSFFWLLAYCIIASLCLCSFFYSTKKLSIFYYILLINAILIIGLVITWRIIQVTSTIDRTKSIIITDQSSLDKFIDDIYEETKRKHEEEPINVPCGLLLYALDIPDPEHVSISGYIWNKYNEKLHKNLSHTILLPQATRMEFGKPTSSITDDWETIIWHIKGIIAQEQNYTAFPFDKQQIKIIIEHQDIQKNIFLTPDLSAYKKLSPESTPGINKEFSLAGFVIEQTFFNYHIIDTSTNFGFKEYGKVTDHFELMYNIVISRNLLNSFVLYFLPLLVILFSLFSTLLVSEHSTNPFRILGPYTGLFFALVILQRSVRETYPTGSTLYIEYAFFYTYLTIILLVLHTILTHYYGKHPDHKYYRNIVFPLIKLAFWPLQLAAWLITTLIVFY